MGLTLSILYGIFQINNVDNWFIFLLTIAGIVLGASFIFFLIGKSFVWISHINSIITKRIKPASRLLAIEIINKDHEDLIDFEIRLERLTFSGHTMDYKLSSQDKRFMSGIGIDNEKIPAGGKATINIVHVDPTDNNKETVEFLTKDNIADNQLYDLNELFEVPTEKRRGEWRGAIYEFVLYVSGKYGNDYFSRWYLANIIYQVEKKNGSSKVETTFRWGMFEDYSKGKEKRRKEYRPTETMTKEKFSEVLRLIEFNKRNGR